MTPKNLCAKCARNDNYGPNKSGKLYDNSGSCSGSDHVHQGGKCSSYISVAVRVAEQQRELARNNGKLTFNPFASAFNNKSV